MKNTTHKGSHLNLPLSWIKIPQKDKVEFEDVPILPDVHWTSLAKVPTKINAETVLKEFISDFNPKTILRGCNFTIAKFLEQSGFDKLFIGQEAILEFNKNHFSKKSLKELIRRGGKYGYVKEIQFNEDNMNKIESFKKLKCVHSSEPQLKHLYYTSFVEGTRMFIFENKNNEWLAAIQISTNSKDKFHTELLLRKKNAPVGVMENLIYNVFLKLRETGYSEWSLGEVPFIINRQSVKIFSKDYFVNKIGQLIRFAYNYEGLYNFKNKFNPRWDDLYICAHPKVRLIYIVQFIIKSNLHKLITYKLLNFSFRKTINNKRRNKVI